MAADAEAILAFCCPPPPPSHDNHNGPVGPAPAPLPPLPPALAALLPPTAAARDGFRARVRQALELVESMLALFPLESLALTFNGGKDACVVFYLVRAAIVAHLRRRRAEARRRRGRRQDQDQDQDQDQEEEDEEEEEEEEEAAAIRAALRRVRVLYFEPRHGEFPEVAAFMRWVAQDYCGGGGGGGGGGEGIEYTVYRCGYQEGMRDQVENHGLKAVFMGVRSGDPYSLESEHVQPSSPGWPPFLRVNPILKWDYGHVWTFLRGLSLPYCVLYDHGYTSIGDVRTTTRNPALLKPEHRHLLRRRLSPAPHQQHHHQQQQSSSSDGGGSGNGGSSSSSGLPRAPDSEVVATLPDDPAMYLPAYALEDYTLERANRRPAGAPAPAPAPLPSPVKQSEAATAGAASPPSPEAIGDESVDGSDGSAVSRADRQAAQSSAAAAGAGAVVAGGKPGHVRKRGSFGERLPAALLCVGDFLSHRDSAPMALAHELRELRCRVAPLVLVPPQREMVAAYLRKLLLRGAVVEEGGGSQQGEAAAAVPVFVLCIDEDAQELVRQALASAAADADEEKEDASTGCAWRQATPHIESCGDRVYLLPPAFASGGRVRVSLEEQKAELDALLDGMAAAHAERSGLLLLVGGGGGSS